MSYKNLTTKKESEKMHSLMDKAYESGVVKVESLARMILHLNRKKTTQFIMAMGTWYFTDQKDNIIHNGDDAEKDLIGYEDLNSFILEWDSILHLTGEPMRFKHKGEKITDW